MKKNGRGAAEEGGELLVSPAKARQGVKDNVRHVLSIGTIGAVAALVLVYFAFFAG